MAMMDGYGGCNRCTCKKEPIRYNCLGGFKKGDIVLYENNKRIEIVDSLHYLVEHDHSQGIIIVFAHSSSHNAKGWRVIGNVQCCKCGCPNQ